MRTTSFTGRHDSYWPSFLLGAFCSFGAFIGLFGRVFDFSSGLLGVATVPASAIILFIAGRGSVTRWATWTPLIAAIAISLLAAAQASDSQWQFAWSLSEWAPRDASYYDSKLLMLGVTIVPQLALTAIAMLAADKDAMIDGVLLALAGIAAIATSRVLVDYGSTLLRTEFLVAREFYRETARGYSLVSYGTLMALGSIAALRFRLGWALSSVLLFMTALLSRRTETIALVGVIVTFAAIGGYKSRGSARFIGVLALSAFLFIALHNGHNLHYFGSLTYSFQERIGILRSSNKETTPANISSPKQIKLSAAAPAEVASTDKSQDFSASPSKKLSTDRDATSNLFSPLLGKGLGSFQNLTTSNLSYPHNVLVETFLELGPIASVFTAVLYLTPLLAFSASLFRGYMALRPMLLTGSLFLAMIISLKAGDITAIGRSMFISSLALVGFFSQERCIFRVRNSQRRDDGDECAVSCQSGN